MVAYDEGWHEPEYNPGIGRAWRWASEQATLWVRPIGRAVTLRWPASRRCATSTRRRTVRVVVGGSRSVAVSSRAATSNSRSPCPPISLSTADGRVMLETSRFFVAGGNGQGDQRHLSLRIFAVAVD